jgi:hypothetical protein
VSCFCGVHENSRRLSGGYYLASWILIIDSLAQQDLEAILELEPRHLFLHEGQFRLVVVFDRAERQDVLSVLEHGTCDEPPVHAEEDALFVFALELGGGAEVLDLGFPLQFEEVLHRRQVLAEGFPGLLDRVGERKRPPHPEVAGRQPQVAPVEGVGVEGLLGQFLARCHDVRVLESQPVPVRPYVVYSYEAGNVLLCLLG